jgi:hypothetical protein
MKTREELISERESIISNIKGFHQQEAKLSPDDEFQKVVLKTMADQLFLYLHEKDEEIKAFDEGK